MRNWRYLVTLLAVLSIIGVCYAENISVELLPSSISKKVNDSFTLDLVIKNIPEDTKCGGFDAKIYYNPNIINLTNINLSSISNNAALKNTVINNSDGWGYISLLWSSNEPYGNFTIATLTFKTLNEGSTNISLDEVAVSNTDGTKYSNVIVKNSTVSITSPKPDLIVENISLTNFITYQNNTIPVIIKNIGEINATKKFNVSLYTDAKLIGSVEVSGLNVNESKTLYFTFAPTENNNYTVVAMVDSSNSIIESNESNNKYIMSIPSIEKPISLNLIPSNILTKTDETFTINITLNNITSDRPAKGIDGIIIYDSSTLTCEDFKFLINSTENLQNISYGNGNITFSIMGGVINTSTPIAQITFKGLKVGTSNIYLNNVVVSDINGYKFNKVTINNNTSITIEGPNIKILNISTGQLYYRIPATINITITNNGHQDIVNKSFDVKLYADTKEIGTLTVDNLKVGEVKTLQFNWLPEDLKTYTIVGVVDENNIISEENESDNKLVVKKTVVEKPISLKIYKNVENNSLITASIDLINIPKYRPCGGMDVYISLKNLKLVGINTLGISNYTVENNTLFITLYNISKEGSFNIANISFSITNNTYSAIINKAVISDNQGHKFKLVNIINNIVDLEYIEKFVIVNKNISDIIETDNIEYIIGNNYNITVLPLKTEKDELTIPILPNKNNTLTISNDTIQRLNEVEEYSKNLENITITNTDEINNIIEKNILPAIKPIISDGFNITNITDEEPKVIENKIISRIKFKAINTSQKGFVIVRIPIGTLNIDSINVNNGTANIILKENDTISPFGWYKIPKKGILEITLIKDPEVTVTLSAPITTTEESSSTTTTEESSSSSSSGGSFEYYYTGGSSHYSPVIGESLKQTENIKSESVKEFVSKAKLILGSPVDLKLSGKELKEGINTINKPIEIKSDCILVGGPVANPTVKKYINYFPVKVTNNYPGAKKGVIEKQLINGHTVILLAGSDRWGTKAAVEYFKQLDDIPDEPIFVEWKDGKAVKIEKP